MGASFRLSDLVPEPLAFCDDAFGGDGTTHDVRTADLLSEADIAALLREERRMAAGFAAERSDEALDAANRLIRILIPTLPPERLATIPIAFKAKFIEFWQEQQPQPQGPKAQAATTTTPPLRGRRSRGSSPPTA